MGIKEDRLEINKILSRLQAIARQGTAGYRDYDSYINELINKGKLNYLQQCAEIYFDVDHTKLTNLGFLKNVLWDKLLADTKLSFLSKLQKLLSDQGVYQIGTELRDARNANFNFELSPTLDESLQVIATASKVDFAHSDGTIRVNLLDPNISNIVISRVDWATYSAVPKSLAKITTISAERYFDTISVNGPTANGDILDLIACTNSLQVNTTVDGVNRLDLDVNIAHTFTGDIQINLIAPNGRVMNVKRQGGILDKGENMNVRFSTSNEYARLIRTNKNDVTGTYSIDRFIGIGDAPYVSDTGDLNKMLISGSPVGTWTLFIKDVGTKNTGSLLNWALHIGAQRTNEYCTQTSYKTDITTIQGGVYHVEVTKKNPYGKFTYRLSVTKDDLLGTATEVDFTSTVDANYYVRNRRVMEVLGLKKYYLEVRPNGSQEVVTMMSEEQTLSEEANLLRRYSQAIAYLKDQNKISQIVEVLSVVSVYPTSPNPLDRYLHSTDGIIEWTGRVWFYHIQYPKMRILVKDTGNILKYDGENWNP